MKAPHCLSTKKDLGMNKMGRHLNFGVHDTEKLTLDYRDQEHSRTRVQGERQNTVQEGWHEEENQEAEEKTGGHLSAL